MYHHHHHESTSVVVTVGQCRHMRGEGIRPADPHPPSGMSPPRHPEECIMHRATRVHDASSCSSWRRARRVHDARNESRRPCSSTTRALCMHRGRAPRARGRGRGEGAQPRGLRDELRSVSTGRGRGRGAPAHGAREPQRAGKERRPLTLPPTQLMHTRATGPEYSPAHAQPSPARRSTPPSRPAVPSPSAPLTRCGPPTWAWPSWAWWGAKAR